LFFYYLADKNKRLGEKTDYILRFPFVQFGKFIDWFEEKYPKLYSFSWKTLLVILIFFWVFTCESSGQRGWVEY
jgi:hypothetical protein